MRSLLLSKSKHPSRFVASCSDACKAVIIAPDPTQLNSTQLAVELS